MTLESIVGSPYSISSVGQSIGAVAAARDEMASVDPYRSIKAFINGVATDRGVAPGDMEFVSIETIPVSFKISHRYGISQGQELTMPEVERFKAVSGFKRCAIAILNVRYRGIMYSGAFALGAPWATEAIALDCAESSFLAYVSQLPQMRSAMQEFLTRIVAGNSKYI